jgi:TM2 domain-containing membrane protein YozV
MSTPLLYIGPGMGIGTIVLVLIIGGIVLFSFGYIIYMKLKRRFRKKDK